MDNGLPAVALFSGESIDSGWIRFRAIYGNYGLHYFSIPLLNRDKTKALMTAGGWGGSRLGSGDLLLLVKKGDRWRIVKERLRWVI